MTPDDSRQEELPIHGATTPLCTGRSWPVPGSTSAQRLTINGTSFVSGATVTYHDPQGNSYPGHTTTFNSSSQLVDTAFDDANDGGTWTVTVVNPSGSSSAAVDDDASRWAIDSNYRCSDYADQ